MRKKPLNKEARMQEKRKFPRLDFNVEVEWKRLGPSVKEEAKNLTKNISGGGICMFVDSSVNVNDTLELNITLPTQERVSSKGVVRWVENFGISSRKEESHSEAGIEFIDINSADRQKVDKFIFRFLNPSA